ncbi:hypothetical protein [Castellaniella denitrificans]|uniref:Uncharacterized protein n=1 Tax=Castellaniella denitrificans TaxID=56119 RepID=A0ABT4M6W4_9BURK|nr:hypothetical protein [Castellaniella denitrificans]MCZ4331066.1 hypothetical protein [Castellaniella denitrificans]
MEFVHYVAPSYKQDELFAKANEVYGEGAVFPYANGFFVTTDDPTSEVSTKIGIRDGSVGSGVVLRVTTYNGRAPADLWEWLAKGLA